MNSTSAVANEFLSLAESDVGIDDLTNLKLVKLIYISQGLSLAFFNKPLFEENIEAWMYGPIVPSIYNEFKHFGKSKITAKSVELDINFDSDDWDFEFKEPKLTDENSKKVVQLTWNWYKDIPAGKLIGLTHSKGTPWSLTYVPNENKVIPIELIKKYYKLFLENMEKNVNS